MISCKPTEERLILLLKIHRAILRSPSVDLWWGLAFDNDWVGLGWFLFIFPFIWILSVWYWVGLRGACYEDNGRVGRLIFSLSLSVHLQTENDKYKYKYRGKDKDRDGMGLSGPGMRIMVGCDDWFLHFHSLAGILRSTAVADKEIQGNTTLDKNEDSEMKKKARIETGRK